MITCIHCRASLPDSPHADTCRGREIINRQMAEAIIRRLGLVKKEG